MHRVDHSGPPSTLRRLRLTYAAVALCVVAAGLLWRWPELGLPQFASKYGGSILWGSMVFFVIAALGPAMKLMTVAGIAAMVAAAVEFSQLMHAGWLDDFRRTAIGALLLGRTFTWWDILAYWIGIGVGYGAVLSVRLIVSKKSCRS